MRYCMNCGEEIRGQAAICPVCKLALTADALVVSAPKAAERKPNRRLLLSVGISAFVLLVLCAAALFLLPGKNHTKNNNLTVPAQIFLDTEEVCLIEGQKTELEASTKGIDTDERLRWDTEDSNIARMDGNTLMALSPGRTMVTVSVGGTTAKCLVTVTARRAESIEIDEAESTTVYFVGKSPCDGDIVLNVRYNNGETETLTSGFDTEYDFSRAGGTKLTATYDEQTDSIHVTVKEILPKELELVSVPTDTSLIEGQTLDTSGLQLRLIYNDGHTELLTDGYTCSPTTFPSTGQQSVTVTYGELKTTFDVTVAALPRYTISASSSNSSYGSVSGSGTYAQGTTITLTATPKSNCIFDHWSDGSTEASRTVTVSKNVSYQAVFYGPESGWVSSVPEGAVETDRRTVYTKTETVTTAGTSPGSDYVLIKDEWVKRTSGTVNYAPRLSSGIQKSGSVYEQYCQSPVRAYSNTSEKLVIDSDQRIGWLYHHYCRGTYTSGPINRQTNYISAGEFSVYHIYFDAKEPGYYGSQYTDHCGHNPACDGSGSWGRANAGVCRDSYWYYATEINRQTYTIYDRQCTYKRTAEYTSNPGGDVSSRTEYRYRLK